MNRRRFGLVGIVGAILFVQIAAITFTLLRVNYRSQYALMRSYLLEKHMGSLTKAAERCIPPLATYDMAGVERVLMEEAEHVPQLAGLAVYDAAGQMQAAAPSYELVEQMTQIARGGEAGLGYRTEELAVIDKEMAIKRWNSMSAETTIPLGKMRGIFTLRADLRATRERFRRTMYTALSLAIVGFLVSFLVLRRLVVVPVRDLMNAMTAFALDSDAVIEERPAKVREISDLWTGFLTMRAELKRSQGQLVQADKMVAVGQLAAGVAHEINNPLGIILGFSQNLAGEGPLSESMTLAVKSIEREAMRCKRLVEDMLTFSRQGGAAHEAVDLAEMVGGVLDMVEARTRVSEVELVRELGPAPKVVAAKNQLQQVVINLCNNAVDAMPNGGTLTIRTGGTGALAAIEVQDTGTGIPEEIRGQIFNPFFTTKDVGKGTGLGLSLVYEIIQNHKGDIKVESEVGKGTKFVVTLPATS